MKWPVASLGDLCSLVMGQAPPGNTCNKTRTGTPFVKAGEFSSRRPVVREWTTSPLKLAMRSDVLVCVVGATAGKVNQGIDCAIGRSVAAVRPDDRVLVPEYLYHFLNGQVSRLRMQSQGLAQGVITRDMLAMLQLPAPPLDEQRRIAAVLDRADSLRTKRLQATSVVESLTRSIFRDMFGEFCDTKIEWPILAFGDLISGGPQNGLYKPAKDYGAGTPIVRIDSYQDGLPIDIARLKHVRVSGSEADTYGLMNGDIVINRVNARTHLGKATMVAGLSETTVFESNMMRLRLDNHRARPEYVLAALGSSFLKNQIQAAAKDAVNQSSINQKDVAGFKIPLPPMDQQGEYVRRRQRVQQLHPLDSRSATVFDELFTSLQSRAFRGEL